MLRDRGTNIHNVIFLCIYILQDLNSVLEELADIAAQQCSCDFTSDAFEDTKLSCSSTAGHQPTFTTSIVFSTNNGDKTASSVIDSLYLWLIKNPEPALNTSEGSLLIESIIIMFPSHTQTMELSVIPSPTQTMDLSVIRSHHTQTMDLSVIRSHHTQTMDLSVIPSPTQTMDSTISTRSEVNTTQLLPLAITTSFIGGLFLGSVVAMVLFGLR